ncbi:MAG: YncE family protein [Bacteroidales bacterium]|nr:YncE family protein [Bacteroidales bacterium]
MILSPRLVSALLPVLLTMIFLSSCMDDEAWYEMNDLQVRYDTTLNNAISRQTGVFVVNEGNFMYDNASLSYYLIDSMQHLNDVFYRTNGTPLGDVAQSMVIRDSLGYIVVNNSSKIYVINTNTFEFVGKITGLTSPRHMHFVDAHKAYVSDLYAGAIAIVDPVALEILGYIDVRNPASPFNQHPTEQFVQIGKNVYTNCWSYDNTILVIDSETDQVTDSIKVPLQPNSMVADRFGKLWVLCDGGFKGNPAGHERPALVRIDPALAAIETMYAFGLDDQPTELQINGTGDTLYFLNRHLYRHIATADTPPQKILESTYTKSTVGGFYGLGIDPYSGDIYLGDAIDQVQRGVVYRYKADITVIDTFRTGINPGFFCFRQE